MFTLFGIIFKNFTFIDLLIIAAGIWNLLFFYRRADREAEILHRHFNRTDRISPLTDDAKARFENVSGQGASSLSPDEILRHREEMNKNYSSFSIITTMFPLGGMFGTVISLIPMVNSIGAEDTQLFFGALTSTFWGILFALICKIMDTRISYKIDDNEKHVEYLLNPKR